MATDWAADVKKYAPNADDGVIAAIVRYCGIALRNVDSSLVAFSDPTELARVRTNYLQKKLGLTQADSVLDAAIAKVGEIMKADRTKNRVTVYYLLAAEFGKLGLFAPKGKVAAVAAPVAMAPAAKKTATSAKAPAAKAPAAKAPAKAAAAPAKAKPAAKSTKAAGAAAAGAAGVAALASLNGAKVTKPAAKKPAAKAATAKAAPAKAAPAKPAAVKAAAPAKTATIKTVAPAAAPAPAPVPAPAPAPTPALAAKVADVPAATAAAAAPVAAAVAATTAAATMATSAAAKPAATAQRVMAEDEGNEGGLGWLWWLLGLALLTFAAWWLFGRDKPADGAAVATGTEAAAAASADAGTAATSAAVTDLAAAPAEGSVTIPTGAGVTAETRDSKPVVKVYFDSGKTEVAPAFTGAAGALKTWLDSHAGSTLQVSGYNDPTGNAAKNAELSKNRAQAVAAELVKAGIPEGSVELVKPEATTDATVSKEAARRVEVTVK